MLSEIMNSIKEFIKSKQALKKIIIRLYFDSGGKLNYSSLPFHYGIIPQYYLSRFASWLYGSNILKRKNDSKILQWLNGGEKALNNSIYSLAKSTDPKSLSDDITSKNVILRPLVEIIKNKYKTETLLKVIDIGCGDGITSFALASSMKDYRFEVLGFDPATVRIDNVIRLFREKENR